MEWTLNPKQDWLNWTFDPFCRLQILQQYHRKIFIYFQFQFQIICVYIIAEERWQTETVPYSHSAHLTQTEVCVVRASAYCHFIYIIQCDRYVASGSIFHTSKQCNFTRFKKFTNWLKFLKHARIEILLIYSCITLNHILCANDWMNELSAFIQLMKKASKSAC